MSNDIEWWKDLKPQVIEVSEKEYDRLIKILNNPPKLSKKILEAIERHDRSICKDH